MLSILTAITGSAPAESAVLDPAQLQLAAIIYGFLFLAGLAVDLGLVVLLLNRPPHIGRRIGRLLRRPIRLRDAGALLALLMTLYIVAGVLAAAVPMREGTMMAVQSFLLHWLLLALLVAALRRRGLSARRAFGLRARGLGLDAAAGVLCYLAMVPVFLFVTVIYSLALKVIGYEPTLQPVTEILTSEPRIWLRVYLLFMAVVLAAVVEELIFRGVALPVLARRLGTGPAILLVSLIFAVIHFHVEAIVPLFIASVCFGLAYAVTGRIAVPMVMHGLFNGVNLLVLLAGAP